MLEPNHKTQFKILVGLNFLVAIILWYVYSQSHSLSGGADSYNHFLIAKYSWKYPHLLLDYWGKPMYNLIASGFTQFGVGGSIVLNILCLIGSSLLAFFTAKQLNYKWAIIAGIVCLFSPVFLDNTISSLTEPLCALFLVGSIYLLSKEKYSWAALVAGFLPHLRSEGLILALVFALYILIKHRSWKSMLLLGVGTLIFNTLGWIQTGQPLWILQSNPYINAHLAEGNICGSGTPFHYFWTTHYTFGLIVSFLLAAIGGLIGLQVLRKKLKPISIIPFVLLIFLTYYGAHMLVWWKGWMGSCGYIRVMLVLSPVVAILLSYGFETLSKVIQGKIQAIVVGIFLVGVIVTPFRYYTYRYPLKMSEEEQLFVEVNEWYQNELDEKGATIYLYPFFSVLSDLDPYNNKESFGLYKSNLQYITEGDIVIWDAHFGPNEGGILKEVFESDSSFTKLKEFWPEIPYKTLNDFDYHVAVYRKID